MNNMPQFTETNAASHLLIQMPLRVVLFPSCFWQTRTLALPRSMFGSAERVLVDIARKKQMPLRVALFLLAFCRLEPSRCRAPCSAPPNGFSLISQEKNKCRFASRFFFLLFADSNPRAVALHVRLRRTGSR